MEIDFPPSMKDWKSVDLQNLIDADIVHNVKNKGAYNTLKALGIDADSIIIATDYDREGELIGVEALNVVLEDFKKANKEIPSIKRAKFSALTNDEITSAFSDLIDVDYNLADAAGAREEIDLVWGAVLTRFFSVASNRLGKNFLSIGRVQTPTLALIVKRELEIRDFVSEPFWKIEITFNKKRNFKAEYEGGAIFSEKEAEKIFQEVNGNDGKVLSFEKRSEKIFKPPPFNTTEFLRESSRIGISPAKAMKIAEALYMKGLISYPRTDNTVYQRSISLKSVLNKLKESDFSEEAEKVLSLGVIKPSRGKTQAMDHPPIYPVNAAKPKSLKGDFAKIYELVVRRFLATLYIEGEREVSEAALDVSGYRFNSKGVKVTKQGWLELYPYREVLESFVPDLEVGEEVKAKNWELISDQTKPPNRYAIASLIKKMEELSLGTKSTRHDIIEKLQNRGFIEGNPARPTYLGIGLIKSILTVESKISDPEMTAQLEKDMDRIANSEVTKSNVVQESKKMLSTVLGDFREKKELIGTTIQEHLRMGDIIGKCPKHGTDIVQVKNKAFSTIRCETEGCEINFNVSGRGLIQVLDDKCPECSLPKIKIIRRGQSPDIRCVNPKCSFNQKKDSFGTCPEDGGTLILRQSRYGKRFLGCSNYPSCKVTYPLPQMGYLRYTEEKCEFCGSPLIVMTRGKQRWKFCPNMGCEFNKKKAKGVKKTEKQTT